MILLLLLLQFRAHAYFEHSLTSPAEMNGISFQKYKDFPSKWKLVTVRFREDTKELRLTYANDIAFKAMKALTPNYPDGAVFGKVAFSTEEDPSFPSSRFPTSTRRFQLMVKSRKLYGSTNNWGYALFDENGKLFKEDVKEKTEACAACHQLVPERDYVFSRSFHQSSSTITGTRSEALKFLRRKSSDFQGVIKEQLSKNSGDVESLEGPLQKHAFSGTLDEVIPLLLERARLMQKSSLLFVNPKNFSLVKLSGFKGNCPPPATQQAQIVIFYNGSKVREADHCL